MDELINGSDTHHFTTVGVPNDEYSLYNIEKLYDRDWENNYWSYKEIIRYIQIFYLIQNSWRLK